MIRALLVAAFALAASPTFAAPTTYPLGIDKSGKLVGLGANILVADAAYSQFILYGQDEGFADSAIVLRALAREVRPFGFHTLVIEAGTLTTEMVARSLHDRGLAYTTAMLRRAPLASILTLNTTENLALIADFTRSDPTSHVWGVDMEAPGAATLLLERLAALAPNATARAAVARWQADQADVSKPFMIFTTTGSDFRNMAMHFAGIGEAQRIIAALRVSATVYQMRKQGHFYSGEAGRAGVLRENFLRFYRNAGGQPGVIALMGGNHLGLGITPNGTLDIGTLATSIAALGGRTALRILFFPAGGPNTDNKMSKVHPYYQEQYDDADPKSFFAAIGVDPSTLGRDRWTLIPLAPIRAALIEKGLDNLPAQIRFFVLGYDYVVTTPAAKPATPIQ